MRFKKNLNENRSLTTQRVYFTFCTPRT